MRAGRLIAVLAVALLGIGLFSAVAMAGGKKKSTTVIYFSGSPKFNSSGKVTVKGALNSVKACRISRAVRLQLLDSTGVVTTTLDGSSTDSNGNFSLSGQLPSPQPGTNSVRVKALKETAGKFVCKAGVSTPVVAPASK